jgi:hypothetical protein
MSLTGKKRDCLGKQLCYEMSQLRLLNDNPSHLKNTLISKNHEFSGKWNQGMAT